MAKEKKLIQKVIKSLGDATGIVPEGAIYARNLLETVKFTAKQNDFAKVFDRALIDVPKQSSGLVFGSLRRFLFPLSSRFHEDQKRKLAEKDAGGILPGIDLAGSTREIVGSVGNLAGDIALLVGSVVISHAMLGFYLVKGITNLGALWTADLFTDVQANEGKRFVSRRNLRKSN